MRNQTDPKQEEKFDYTDSEFDVTIEKQASLSPLKFHDFMDRLVGKNKLLAQAEQYDKARGISLPKNVDTLDSENENQASQNHGKVVVESPILKEQNLNKAKEAHHSERRITSVEHPKLNKQMNFNNDSSEPISATPYVANPKGTTIEEHMMVQSTPLSKTKPFINSGKVSTNSQPKDLLKEKFQESRKQSLTENDIISTQSKGTDLKDELITFKKELESLNRLKKDQELEIQILHESSSKKDEELSILTKKYTDLITTIEETKRQTQNTEKEMRLKAERLSDDIQNKETSHALEIKKLKTELKSFEDLQAGLVEQASVQKRQEELEKALSDLTNVGKSKDVTIEELTSKVHKMNSEQEQLSLQLLQSKTLVEQINDKLNAKSKVEAENSDLKTKLAAANEENSNLTELISKFTLFGVNLGVHLTTLIEKQKSLDSCEIWLKTRNIIGFKTETDAKLTTSLKESIEKEFKPALEEKFKDISLLQKEVGKKNETITELLDKVTDVQQSREQLITLRDQLTSEVTSLKSQICSSEIATKESAFENLTEHNFKLLEKVNAANNEIATISLELNKVSTSLLQEREITSSSKSTILQLENSLSKLRKSFEKVKGNTADKITPEILTKIHAHMNKESYDKLELDNIDNLNLVECQNTIKNIVAILDISYSKLSSKLPLVNIMLRYEKTMLFHFANRIHNLLFHQEIDFKNFTRKALENYWTHKNAKAVQHPLEQCLKDLYKSVSERLVV
ncbi:unnamed protein product [Kluyveromyces dobzhanskii CBS 2104]|uniref:WGS project CCBQ000000000 data, contig 00266 n=1 Tax=Kluyveromyces dobzhanskii CBS 2104 TaxID=1427455 RepID=A0A0A8L5D2_9SACH|nr:unnamed protein product [Kluyveromyces dobzhanskii CBS 2104]